MNSFNQEKSNKNRYLARYVILASLVITGLFLTGCVIDPYEDDEYYSSQGQYHGDYDQYDDEYIDEPNTQVDVYVSGGSHSHRRSRYNDPYYARHYNGYYFDPFYGVYYSYGSGIYGAYGSYRRGYGYYCPVHRSYFGHGHYRSHSHRRHHHNVRRYDRNRDYRDRRDIIQPDRSAILSNGQVGGARNSDRNRTQRNRDLRLPQRGLDGVVPNRRDVRTRRRVVTPRANPARNNTGTAPRPRVQNEIPSEVRNEMALRRQAQAAENAESRRRAPPQAKPQQVRRPNNTPRSEPRSERRSEPRQESRRENRSQPRRSNRNNDRRSSSRPTQRH